MLSSLDSVRGTLRIDNNVVPEAVISATRYRAIDANDPLYWAVLTADGKWHTEYDGVAARSIGEVLSIHAKPTGDKYSQVPAWDGAVAAAWIAPHSGISFTVTPSLDEQAVMYKRRAMDAAMHGVAGYSLTIYVIGIRGRSGNLPVEVTAHFAPHLARVSYTDSPDTPEELFELRCTVTGPTLVTGL